MILLHKHESHETKILKHLKKVGHHGAFNHELAKQSIGGWKFHQRITDLRKDGYGISCQRLTRGSCKYYLDSEPEK